MDGPSPRIHWVSLLGLGGLGGLLVSTFADSVLPEDLRPIAFWIGVGLLIAATIVGLHDARGFVGAPRAKPTGHMSAQQYLRYMLHESDWGRRVGRFGEPDFSTPGVKYAPSRALFAVRQFAQEAKKQDTPIKAFGVPNGVGDAKVIEPLFWMTNGLDTVETLDQYGASRTEPKMVGSSDRYEHVEIERAGVEQAWPRMNFFYRQLKRLRDRREQKQRSRIERQLRAEQVAESEPDVADQPSSAPTPAAPPRLTHQEIERRVQALEEMHAAIVPEARAAIANVLNLIHQRRTTLLDYEDGKHQISTAIYKVREVYQQIKKDRDAIQKRHEMYASYPKAVFHFGEAQRVLDGTNKMAEAIGHLTIPITEGQVALLQPWAYTYEQDVQQFAAWVNDVEEQIKQARKAIVDGQ